MRVSRGEVHWADLEPVAGSEQGGLRPMLIYQANPLNEHANTTIVLAITSRSQRAGYPLTVALARGEGRLPKASWVKVTQLRTLSLKRLRGRLGELSRERLREIDKALLEVLDIDIGDAAG